MADNSSSSSSVNPAGFYFGAVAVGSGWTYDGATLAATLNSDNNEYAKYTIPSAGGPTTPLIVQDFGFDIPANATINGIEVQVQHRATTLATAKDSTVQLLDEASNAVGDNIADTNYWGTTDENITYGGSVDKVGWTNPTPAKINNSNFGLSISVSNEPAGAPANEDIFIDYIKITVYWDNDDTITNFPVTSSGWTNSSYAELEDLVSATNIITAKASSGAPISVGDTLLMTGFGFNIPSNRVINGITVTLARFSNLASSLEDVNVQLLTYGTSEGTNNANVGTSWPTGVATTTYGGVSNNWGISPTPDIVNDTGFGLQVTVGNQHIITNGTANVNYASITLHLADNESSSSQSSASTISTSSSDSGTSSSTVASVTSSSSSTQVSVTSSLSSSSTAANPSSSSEIENIRVIQTITDGGHEVVVLVVRSNTETANDNGTIILDASELANAAGSEQLSISEIIWTIQGPTTNKTLTLYWAGTPDKEIATLFGSGKWALRVLGLPTLPNEATLPTGDILVSTSNFRSGDSYSILLKSRKVEGYTY